MTMTKLRNSGNRNGGFYKISLFFQLKKKNIYIMYVVEIQRIYANGNDF